MGGLLVLLFVVRFGFCWGCLVGAAAYLGGGFLFLEVWRAETEGGEEQAE